MTPLETKDVAIPRDGAFNIRDSECDVIKPVQL